VGIKEAGIVQTIIVSILIFILAIYVFYGITHMTLDNFTPFMPKGIGSVFSTSGLVFISYGGILKVASIAEEVRDPGKNVPRAMILSLGAVLILYAAVVFITTGVMSSVELDNSLTPISDGAGILLGTGGKIVLSIAAILAFISTANAGIMSASRYPMALSRDHLLPESFSRVHKRFKTPYISLLFTGAFMLIAIFLKLKILVEVASTVLIFTFIFSCICVIIMRESGVQNYRPSFRSPFYPWVQIGGIFGSWLLVVNMGKEALFLGSLIFAAALAVFWFYGRRRAKRDFALLHLIEKVTAREFLDVTLEEELKEIIRERDEIIKDRFDRVVEESAVLDVEGPLGYEEFFNMAAEKVAPKLDLSTGKIVELFLRREEQASTVLLPGLAVPHIVVPGKSKFIMLLARCRKGIDFPSQEEPVRTVFVIAGSRDERNFHLRALSAIAQIVDDPSFRKRWHGASNRQALKDIVLLGKRKRNI
jgi:mannitol/fructose-specific phosphotransferase system IIA component (Ntr-type)